MSTIPKDEIKKIAEERYPDNHANSILGNNVKQMRRCFIDGYQLATDGRVELEKELELYKKKVEFYREQTDKVRELIFSRNDIGEPCQPLYDAIFDKITALQSQCTEKDQEIERLKEQYGIMDGRRRNAIKSLEESEKQFGELQEAYNKLMNQ